MKKSCLLALFCSVSAFWLQPVRSAPPADAAASAPQPTSTPSTELKVLIEKTKAKLQSGKHAEADFTAELGAFDALLAKYKDQKTDEVAQIPMMKAMLYLQVFDDAAQALPIIRQVKADFPDTELGRRADTLIAQVQQAEEAQKVRQALAVGTKFPTFTEKDATGAPLALDHYHGKIVLVDFWATWCGPCVHELPNVVAAYQKYHDKGFEVVGVSLDKDHDNLVNFTHEHQMPWAQYFDGKGWENKLAMTYGIKSIPATFLLDENGTIIAEDLRDSDLDAELSRRLGGSAAPKAAATP